MDLEGVAAVLRGAGVLGDRDVRDLEVLDVGAFNSETVRVRVEVAGPVEVLEYVRAWPAGGN